jgi:putative flavoprotein involved in K+ transport
VRAVVVGAGSAGIACAVALGKEGIQVEVLERSEFIAESWRSRYPSLRLNTARIYSALPGMGMPRKYGRWPSRDNFVAYLEDYAERNGVSIQRNTNVDEVELLCDRGKPCWRIVSNGSESYADLVVLATGHDALPCIPPWPGLGTTGIPVTHSARYDGPARYAGRDVLVAGAGNSGTEIALDLLPFAARVHLAVRTPPLFIPTELFGLPSQFFGSLTEWIPVKYRDQGSRSLHRRHYGDLARFGLTVPKRGSYREFRKSCKAPVAERGIAQAIRNGQVDLVPAVEQLTADEAVLASGTRLRPDHVIAATGYRPSFPGMVKLPGVLDDSGRPVRWAGPLPGAPGLFIVGEPSLAGSIRHHGREARRVAAAAEMTRKRAQR